MLQLLAQNWWLFAAQGVLAIVFGLAAFLWPGRTLGVLIVLFGAYAFVDGVLSLLRTFRAATLGVTWWPFLLHGLAGLGAGLLTLAWPGLTALLLIYFVGSWALVGGVLQVIAGFMLRRELEAEWRLILSGVLSVIFGVWMIAMPGDGALTLVWVIAIYAIVLGIALIVAALRLRGVKDRLGNPTQLPQS